MQKKLGLNVSSDMKWNFNVESLSKKLISVCFISAYKRHGLGTRALVQFFCTFVRPMTDCARPVFHDILPACVSPMNLREYKAGVFG